jgi:hypothetical protein
LAASCSIGLGMVGPLFQAFVPQALPEASTRTCMARAEDPHGSCREQRSSRVAAAAPWPARLLRHRRSLRRASAFSGAVIERMLAA